MNFLKIIETLLGILAFIGFILMLGAIGTSDYMVEIGEYQPFEDLIRSLIPGLVMFLPGGIYAVIKDRYME